MVHPFPALRHLLAGYLHPDWDLDHTSWREAFDDFVGDWDLEVLIAEIDRALTERSAEEDLRELVVSSTGGHLPVGDDGTTRGWVLELRARAYTAASLP